MMTSSNGNIFRVNGPLCEQFTGDQWTPLTKASDAELWCFFDLRLNKRLSKQSSGLWFEMPSLSSWRHCNVEARIFRDNWVNTMVADVLAPHVARSSPAKVFPMQHKQILLLYNMMTSLNGNISRVAGPLWGETIAHPWIPLTRASDGELWYSFDLRLNKNLSQQARRRWFETPSRSLWRHCNEKRFQQTALHLFWGMVENALL